jgi:two-component system, OmpR family, response regulator
MEGSRTAVIVEDDPDVRSLLRVALEGNGLSVHEANSGYDGVDLVLHVNPTLVTMDLGLPGLGGMEACRRIRAVSDVYIIMVTASSDQADCLVALASGADDYVTKPFSVREIQARVAAVFRRPLREQRTPGTSAPGTLSVPLNLPPSPVDLGALPAGTAADLAADACPPDLIGSRPLSQGAGFADEFPAGMPTVDGSEPVGPDNYQYGPVRVDVESRRAWLHDNEVLLTRTEFDLLATMLSSPRRAWRREVLLNLVWGEGWADQRLVEVHIGNLRRKFSSGGGDGSFITTVRGVGYRLASMDPTPPSIGP